MNGKEEGKDCSPEDEDEEKKVEGKAISRGRKKVLQLDTMMLYLFLQRCVNIGIRSVTLW